MISHSHSVSHVNNFNTRLYMVNLNIHIANLRLKMFRKLFMCHLGVFFTHRKCLCLLYSETFFFSLFSLCPAPMYVPTLVAWERGVGGSRLLHNCSFCVPGDQVLEWNGRILQGATFKEVYNIILESKPEPQVELVVSRPIG